MEDKSKPGSGNEFAYVFSCGGQVQWSKETRESLGTRADNDADKDLIADFIEACYPGSFIRLSTGEMIFCTGKAFPVIEDDYEDVDEIMDRILTVRQAIRDKYPPSDKFVEDTIPCPICKTGTVDFVISDHYNGHIHGHCSTPNCVSWME